MKQWMNLLLAATLAAVSAVASAQPFPNKPLKIIVPSTPGDG